MISDTLKPASVFLIDLVGHSMRPKNETQEIQHILRQVFSSAIASLKLQQVDFNYTGDGYFCAFIGDSSTRVLDFINVAIPELKVKLAPFQQSFRAGLDFGLIAPTKVPLSRSKEFFDIPGIQAARLQDKAEIDQILCTDTFEKLFAPHFPRMFGYEAITIKTKDREIIAYPVHIISFDEIRMAFARFFGKSITTTPLITNVKKRILVVEDEWALRELIAVILSKANYNVVCAESGFDALKIFKPGEFDLVLTDIVMPDGISGVDLTKRIIILDPSIRVIINTGFYFEGVEVDCFISGADFFLQKPYNHLTLLKAISDTLQDNSPKALRKYLDGVFLNPNEALVLIQNLRNEFLAINETGTVLTNYTLRFLRHKADHLITEFLANIQPGCDLLHKLQASYVRFNYLYRLCRVLSRIRLHELPAFVEEYILEQEKIYKQIHFSLVWNVPEKEKGMLQLADTVVLIIYELIDNAIGAMKDGGNLQIEISILRASGLLHIVVRDSGSGIPSEISNRVFEEGISTKGIGRGLGLSLIKTVVSKLKGEVRYEFRDGAVFTILIPI